MYHDIVFIGCGFRTASFLLSNKSLLELDLVVIEASDELGSGKFRELDCLSNSNGVIFLRHLESESKLWENTMVKKLAGNNSPVNLKKIAEILRLFGDEIKSRLPCNCILTNTSVVSVNLSPNNLYPVELELSNGAFIYSKFCVLGTGQAEIFEPQLLPWQNKTWLSVPFMSEVNRPKLIARLKENYNAYIVILGCSHSAMACARLLNYLLEEVGDHNCSVDILQRRKVHIYYPNLKEALLHQDEQYEEIANEQFVCAETGEVFKDSGLKHEARQMYRNICSGKYEYIHMRHINEANSYSAIFDEGDLIIQATGLKSVLPIIKLKGEVICEMNDVRDLSTDDYGLLYHKNAKIDGLIAQLRVMPTPEQYIDKIVFNRSLYKNLSHFLLSKFQGI